MANKPHLIAGELPDANAPIGVLEESPPVGSGSLRPLKIIIADDNLQLGDILVRFLTLSGHQAEHVADGLLAWERISADLNHFDLVITDNDMPEITGIELVELLREANYGGKIVVYSSALRESVMQHYHRLRVDRILPKGADPFAMVRAVEELFPN